MIRLACEHLEEHRTRRVETAVGSLVLRGRTVWLADAGQEPVALPSGPASLLRELMVAGGSVRTRAQLMAALPRCESERALETWVWRLRRALPVPGLVCTVVKRGYRLSA